MICKKCGKKAESEYCFRCKPRKALPTGKGLKRVPDNYQERIEKNKEESDKMHTFFMSIWRKRPHVSEVSGERLFSPPSSAYFHHIFEKDKYPEYADDEDNVIVISIDEHTNVGNNKFRYEEINKRREMLEKKYNI